MSPQAFDLAIGRVSRHQWLIAIGAVTIAAMALCVLFAGAVEGAVQVWWNSTAYNHCFLIIPISLYMVLKRLPALRGLEPKPELLTLIVMLPLSALWLLAAMLGILELQQFVIVAMFQIIALAIVGWQIYRVLLGPFLFLFFLVPSGQILVPWLQNFTAHFVVFGLRLTGIPVFGDGITIEIPEGTFMVAEACAGLRFLVASLAFGVFFSWLVYRDMPRRLGFIALSIVVPIFANGLRCYGIVMAAHLIGDAQAAVADHIIYGWGFFSAITILLILIGLSFAERVQASDEPPVPTERGGAAGAAAWLILVAALLGVIGAAIGPAYANLQSGPWQNPTLADLPYPTVASPWHVVNSLPPQWQPIIVGPTRTFLDTFGDDGLRVTRYIALYRRQILHDNLVRGDNRIADERHWRLLHTGRTFVTIDGKAWQIATTELGQEFRHLLVWHFYVANGRIEADPTMAKLAEARAALFGGAPLSAFYAIAASEDDPAHPARETLAHFLAAMVPPPAYLELLTNSDR